MAYDTLTAQRALPEHGRCFSTHAAVTPAGGPPVNATQRRFWAEKCGRCTGGFAVERVPLAERTYRGGLAVSLTESH